MAKSTGIEWCHHTFNLAWGCVKVSPGCTNCYAEGQAARFGHDVWGPAATTKRRTMGDAYWRQPLAWDAAAKLAGERRRVFCGSMCDVFEDHPTIEAERALLWELIGATPNLDWLLLTKRPERIASCLPGDWKYGYHNVWLGTSVESQAWTGRINALLDVSAVCHFLSCEPLLGPLSLAGSTHNFLDVTAPWDTETHHARDCSPEHGCSDSCPEQLPVPLANAIRWVIAGGESGSNARPCELEWLRRLRDECAEHGTAFFLKQLGGHPNKRGHEAAVLDGARHVAFPVPLRPEDLIPGCSNIACGPGVDLCEECAPDEEAPF